MDLTADNVMNVMKDCLLTPEEAEGVDAENLPDWIAPAQGVLRSFGLHRERLEAHREDVKSMLEQLPDNFRKDGGGGWSFLNLCQRKDGSQWADLHQTMEALVAVGNALGYVEFPAPKEMWPMLPGGMPYIATVLETEASHGSE